MALQLNEGRACEAIIRHLEIRDKGVRADVRFPEEEQQHPFPIEAAFTIGNQLYALEHTGIEPFKGHMKLEAQAQKRFTPIIDGLKGKLDTTATFELQIPADAFEGLKEAELPNIQQKLIAWIKTKASTIPRPPRDYRGHSIGPENVPGVPFPVSLCRFEPVLIPGRHFEIRHLISNVDRARVDRMAQAIDKFPKLAGWKRDHSAKTILVLECNDIQLTNPAIVTDTFEPLANARKDKPDETYLVMSCTDPWFIFPISVGGKTYSDLVQESDAEADVHWQINSAALTPLTKR